MRWALAAFAAVVACSSGPTLRPLPGSLTPSPDADFRAKPPPVEATEVGAPVVRTAELANGMRVLVVERPALPIVTLAWASRSARDSGAPREAGLAALTGSALNQGTLLDDGRVLARVRIMGEVPQIATGSGGTVVSLATSTAALSTSVGVLARVVRHPAWTPAGVQAARTDQLEVMLMLSRRIDYQLRDAALSGLFGSEHPPVAALGTHDNVLRFAADDVSAFHATHYGPESSALVVAGAVTLEQAVQLAERHFGDWARNGGKPPAPVQPKLLDHSKPLQALAGAGDRAWFAVALPCPAAGDAREADFDLMAMIVGDLPLSRATRELRHEEGITYAVSARCEQTRDRGTFWITFGVEPERGGWALARILAQIQRLKDEEVPAAELALARTQLLARVGGELSTNASITRLLTSAFLVGQPSDGIARWIDSVHAATSARLRESAKLYFNGHVGVATYGPRTLMEVDLARFSGTEWSILDPGR